MSPLAENIAKVKEAIVRAAREAGRDPAEVTLVAATKVQTSDTIRAAIAAGVTAVSYTHLDVYKRQLHFLAMRLPYPVENPNALLYPEQFAAAPQATVLILVVLMPLIEEVLFRGLLFGGLRRYSRPMAFAVSTLGYALFCVASFVFQPEGADLRYLLLAVQYLPMSLALAWCYDHGGSIWSAVALHMAVNGASLFLAVG